MITNSVTTATPALVPIGMKHVRAKWGPHCSNVGEQALPADSYLTVVEHGKICGQCGREVVEDRRPIVIGALQVIDTILENEGRAVSEVGFSELQAMVNLFEEGALWVLSQQAAHAQDLGLDMALP